MAFVDDVRFSFDALEFCETVRNGVGEGKTTSERAFRDVNKVVAATAALTHFFQLTQQSNPDVIGIYISYSTGASELFTSLRAISIHPNLVSAALDCLISIVRYSLDQTHPISSLQLARAVVKDIVKTRAILIYQLFNHDSYLCSKKALELLRLTIMCHPLFAREIINRFNLASYSMAPSLCSIKNHACRVPFLDFMFTLITANEPEVLRHLSSVSRDVIITCLRTISNRTISQLEHYHHQGKKSSTTIKKNKQDKNQSVMPSHVQRRELISAINFLMAIENHLLKSTIFTVRRSTFLSPVPSLLATIASADIPPRHISPREVEQEQKDLRSTAANLFIQAMKTPQTLNLTSAAFAINSVFSTSSSSPALHFILRAIHEQPSIAKHILEKGNYLSKTPSLSRKWLGQFSIISACLLKIPYVSDVFVDSAYLERCLNHTSHLVRNLGALLTLSLCRIIEDTNPSVQLHRILPSIKSVANLIKSPSFADSDVTQKLIASYQRLFPKNTEGFTTNWMKISMEGKHGNMLAAESTIRAAIKVTPYEAIRKLLSSKTLYDVIIQALHSTEKHHSLRLWTLAHDILSECNLFPKGTEEEIDLYLWVLSSTQEDQEIIAKSFTSMIQEAFSIPYGLYDDLQEPNLNEAGTWKLSLFSAASVRRLKKLHDKRKRGEGIHSENVMEAFLQKVLLSILACQTLLSGRNPSTSYPGNYLSKVLPICDIWQNDIPATTVLKIAANQVYELLSRPGYFGKNSYLRYVFVLSKVYMRSFDAKNESGFVDSTRALTGLAWNELVEWKHSQAEASKSSEVKNTEDCSNNYSKGGINPVHLLLVATGENNINFVDERINYNALRKTLSKEEYLVSLCFLITNSEDLENLSFVLHEILSELNACLDKDVLSEELCQFLYRIIHQYIIRSNSWKNSGTDAVVDHITKVFRNCNEIPFPNTQLGSVLLLATSLVNHPNEVVRLRSQDALRNLSLVTFKPLLSIESNHIDRLSQLLPHSSAIRQQLISQLNKWTEEEYKQHAIKCILVFVELLCQRIYQTEKGPVKFDKKKTIIKLVNSFQDVEDEPDSIFLKSNHFKQLMIDLCALFSRDETKSLLFNLLERTKKTSLSFCFLVFLHNLFASPEISTTITRDLSDQTLVQCFLSVMTWVDSDGTTVSMQSFSVGLETLTSIITEMRRRKLSMTLVNVSDSERTLSTICTKIWSCITNFTTDDSTGDEIQRNEYVIVAGLRCISQILTLDMLLDASAKEALIRLTDSNGMTIHRLIFCSNFSSGNEEDMQVNPEIRKTIVLLVHTAVKQLPSVGLGEETKSSLAIAEAVFSSNDFGYNGSTSQFDVTLRECVQDLRQALRFNGIERQSGQLFQISPYLNSAVAIVPNFDSKRLAQTCLDLFESENLGIEKSQYSRRDLSAKRIASLDTIFVLQTFILACKHALHAPKTPILDIGRVARGGLLSLIICGTSSESEEIRIHSFASLKLLSELVGPLREAEVGSAAGLYRDRRQLSFLLSLFQNSIADPKLRVLPLFAVWFSESVRITLNPGHPSNKIVTRFLLRTPVMDTADALGVLHLMQVEAHGEELRPTRMLALDIIMKGVNTSADATIIRKRRIIDMIMMFGASSIGLDLTLRMKALDCLVSLARKDQFLGLSRDLISSYGILSWLVHDFNVSEDSSHILMKLEILHQITVAVKRNSNSQYIPLLAETLNTIYKLISINEMLPESSELFFKLLECGTTIGDIDPRARQILPTNFADLYMQCKHYISLDTKSRHLIAKTIVRQQNLDVSFDVLKFLLESSSLSDTSPHELTRNLSNSTFEKLMAYAFISESLLHKRVTIVNSERYTIPSDFCASIALELSAFPTTWLSLAAICILDLQGKLSQVSPEIRELLEVLPVEIPEYFDNNMSTLCPSKITSKSKALVDALLKGID